MGKHEIHFKLQALSDEQLISDAFGAERTMIVDKTPTATLEIEKGKQKGQQFKITKTETYIGRSTDNDIRLHDWFVSKKHAMILRQGQNYFIKDLKSWRGTMVNGKFIRESPLKDGDTLQFGSTVMAFHLAAEEEKLQITGRVPEELVEEEEEYVPDASEEEEPVSMESDENETPPDMEAQIRAEEEEVAQMQAAWEPLEQQESASEEQDSEEVVEEAEAPSEEEEIKEEEVSSEEKEVEEQAPPSEEEAPPPEEEKQEEMRAEPSLDIPEEEIPEGVDRREFEMWYKALHNPSKIIRKNAAQFLKKLTGKDYDYE